VASLELLLWLLVLFVYRGGHRGHRFHGAEHTESRDDLHTTNWSKQAA
jgi:hypothetical protein